MTTRRRTIGDNPLDSITVPEKKLPEKKAPEKRMAAEEKPRAPRRESVPMPVVAKTESKSDSKSEKDETVTGETMKGESLKMPKLECKRMSRLFDSNRIRILGGDVAPCVTKLTVPYMGEARGFRLANNDFITIKRDVAHLDIQSADTIRNTGKLLLWSAVGTVLAGPVGALAGSLYGGWARHVTYVEMLLSDGRKIVAATSPATVEELQKEIG
jgi:hypothetical protein